MSKESNMKMNKKEFVAYVADKYGVENEALLKSCDMLLDGLKDVTKQGIKVSFTGFGSFYLQHHKGHPVQFETNSSVVNDYVVFRFSASNVINNAMRDLYRMGNAKPYKK